MREMNIFCGRLRQKDADESVAIVFSATAVLAALVSTGLAITGMVRLANHVSGNGELGMTVILTGLSITLFGLVFLYLQKLRYRKLLKREQSILLYASGIKDRPVTLSEVSLHCSLLVKDSARLLNQLSKLGVCCPIIKEDGELVFLFSKPFQADLAIDGEN